jgi:hypothetical protein
VPSNGKHTETKDDSGRPEHPNGVPGVGGLRPTSRDAMLCTENVVTAGLQLSQLAAVQRPWGSMEPGVGGD